MEWSINSFSFQFRQITVGNRYFMSWWTYCTVIRLRLQIKYVPYLNYNRINRFCIQNSLLLFKKERWWHNEKWYCQKCCICKDVDDAMQEIPFLKHFTKTSLIFLLTQQHLISKNFCTKKEPTTFYHQIK